MLLKMFSVYDSKVGSYLAPFFMNSRGQALRSFIETASDKSNNLGKYPADFTLFEIGSFNDDNCVIELYESRVNLGCAIELVHGDSVSDN